MNYNLFHNTSCLGDAYFFQASIKMSTTSPKDNTKDKFIKYFNDKTVVFNNQIINDLLLLGTNVVNTVRLAGSQFSKINRPIFF